MQLYQEPLWLLILYMQTAQSERYFPLGFFPAFFCLVVTAITPLLKNISKFFGKDYVKHDNVSTLSGSHEALSAGGGGLGLGLGLGGEGSSVARLNFETSRAGVHKCLSRIVGFAVSVAIWPREVVSRRDFILRAVATFWAMSLVGIYPGRASVRRVLLLT